MAAALLGAKTVHPALIVSETPSGVVADPAKDGAPKPKAAASPQAAATARRRPYAGIGPILPSLIRRFGAACRLSGGPLQANRRPTGFATPGCGKWPAASLWIDRAVGPGADQLGGIGRPLHRGPCLVEEGAGAP